MEGARPYLEERDFVECHDIFTVNNQGREVFVAEEPLIGRGVKRVTREDPIIEQFFSTIPDLCGQQVTCGLVWHKNVCPSSSGRYTRGIHYVPTGQPSRKSAHGEIEFYKDQTSDTSFAIKVLQKKDAFHAEEVRCRLHLQHGNIADVYGVIVQGGTVCILMEHAGKPLVEERTWFSECPDRMLLLGKQSFRALKFLHGKGYVHCDLKPDNLMVVREGQTFVLKLIDFGTCCRIREPLPPQAHTTWQYWPPEMWKAREKQEPFLAEASMDVYAMTLTLYFVQMGSHLMLKIPKEAMIRQPDLVKMMGIPESIPPDLRVVMNNCLEVNRVRRITAEEAVDRLVESEPVGQGVASSSREKYLASVSRIVVEGASQRPLIDTLLQQGGSSTAQLARVPLGGVKERSLHEDVARGPAAVRFERKTSKIFQELRKFDSQKAPHLSTPLASSKVRPSGSNGGESSRPSLPGLAWNPRGVEPCVLPTYSRDMQGSYPFASLLEKLALEVKTQPQNAFSLSAPKPATEIPQAPQELAQALGKFGKTKASVSRQKNRAKVRQKSYDRNLNPRKLILGSNEPKACTSGSSTLAAPPQASTAQKLWPLAELPKDVVAAPAGYPPSGPALDDKEDDMDCVIDVFDPRAFQANNDNDITDYMFELVEKQEHEEGPERIRLDMDGMSLSGSERTRPATECGLESGSNQAMGIVLKTKAADTVSDTSGIPNFELL